MSTNQQIEAYLKPRKPKEHEKQLLEIIQKDHQKFSGKILDIGCATGNFIKLMNEVYPSAVYTGFDLSEKLIEKANDNLRDVDASIFVADALKYTPDLPFNIIIASGVMSIFEDFTIPLKKWLSWLDKNGRLYVFGCFNSRNIDTIIRFKNNVVGKGEWEGGLTSYSVHTVGSFLEKLGYNYEFKRFELTFDIPESDNPIQSFTIRTTDGQRLVMTGANNVYELYFLSIFKK